MCACSTAPAHAAANTGTNVQRHLMLAGAAMALGLSACDKPAAKSEQTQDAFTVTRPLGQPSQSPAVEIPQHVSPWDLGNGMRVRLDEPFVLFVADHASWECFDFRESKICETTSPAISDCPAEMPCDAATATFTDGKLSGVSASYRESGYWGALLARTMRLSPANLVVLPVVGNMQTRAWRWQSEQGNLTFSLSDGYDIHGGRIPKPFSIYFGPDKYAPDLPGTVVRLTRPSEPSHAADEVEDAVSAPIEALDAAPAEVAAPGG